MEMGYTRNFAKSDTLNKITPADKMDMDKIKTCSKYIRF